MKSTSRPDPGPAVTYLLFGRDFTEALTEGLRRSAPLHGTPRRPAPCPVRRPNAASALLREYAESILHEYAAALPLSLGPTDPHLCAAFLGRARHALATAADPFAPAADRPPATATPHQELTAATLLIECAARRLPTGPPGDEAARALGQAVRNPPAR
ncbi:hypothetical protein ACWFR1_33205 [Streptomyces sp. NPDC055103]